MVARIRVRPCARTFRFSAISFRLSTQARCRARRCACPFHRSPGRGARACERSAWRHSRQYKGAIRPMSEPGRSMVNVSSGARLLGVVVLGTLAGGVMAVLGPWQFSVLAGWDAAAAAFVAWVWLSVGPFTPEETSAFATREDDNRVA